MPHPTRTLMHRLVVWMVRIGQLALWAILLGFLVLVALPRVTRLDVLVVRGGSMEPAIALGSVVIVDRGDRTPTVGSVASFRDPEAGMVTHRVIALDGRRFVTKGDANLTEDALRREAADVHGTVLVAVPLAGFAIHLIQQPPVFLLLLVATGGVVVIGEVRTILEEVRRLRRKRGLADAD